MQETLADRDEIAVFAVSYDPVETLQRFSDQHGITYDLLADVGSKQMERLGLLNDTIVEERAAWGKEMDEKHENLPYPGTFLLDENGVVIDKKFERTHRLRPSGTVLLADLTDGDVEPAVSATGTAPGMRAAAWLDEDGYYPGQQLNAHVRLEVEEGVHVYVPPLEEGYIPLRVQMSDQPELTAGEPDLPTGEPFTVEGLPEQFFVVEGSLELTIPFYFSDDRNEDAVLAFEIGYQACNENACFAPETITLELPISYKPIPEA